LFGFSINPSILLSPDPEKHLGRLEKFCDDSRNQTQVSQIEIGFYQELFFIEAPSLV